ncbi:MAG TPA: CTP synthase [Nitrososphaerales archaeon]|nr:CTP synthase [Nitrososphaerales archaeon]
MPIASDDFEAPVGPEPLQETKEAPETNSRKFIFITGGVMSGLGKGITSASIAKLLHLSGFAVSCLKIDPYLNVDAGTMNPTAHGEVFVTDDGGETDMDIGNYERFLDANLTKSHNLTTGAVYQKVIQEERAGKYLGKCVQIIPHITDSIKARIRELSSDWNSEILVVECGGTVGDIESLPFLEAFRQMRLEVGHENSLFIHVTLAPVLETVGEQKTKPTQHSVQELRRIGIQPDVIVVRSKHKLTKDTKQKISLFTSVELTCVVSNPNATSIYQVPQILKSEGIVETICSKLRIIPRTSDYEAWQKIAETFTFTRDAIKIAMVGKYTALNDSYASVNESLIHAAAQQGYSVEISGVDATEFEANSGSLGKLKDYHGVLIPQGFGKRGSEGKVMAANYARENAIPFLGLCFGFQMSIVAYARHVLGLLDANSTELNPDTMNPVIDLLPEQKQVKDLGGSMRLGGHDIHIVDGTLASRIYQKQVIRERHRHRYEFNQKYRTSFEKSGLRFSGYSDNGRRTEILEILDHPFYFATQFHPEYISRPGRAEPSYFNFVKAAIARKLSILA